MPVPITDAERALAEAGGIRQASPGIVLRKTVNHRYNVEVLAGQLTPADRVLYAVSADLTSVEHPLGLLAVLEDRLIYLRTWLAGVRSLIGAPQRPTVIEMSLSSVESITQGTVLPFAHNGSIVLVAAGSRRVFHISKKFVGEAVTAIRDAWHSRRAPLATVAGDPPALSDQLTELANLFSTGMLSESEFAAAKRKLLS